MEVLEDPQFDALNSFWPVGHEVAGTTPVAGLPFSFASNRVDIYRTPPTLGRDTKEVLLEAGLSETEVEQLRLNGVTVPEYQAGASE
jgi:crotonobetainyl-CoA:carnitine CoA-transferase CaiB-like acyl-CoA transferase